jgi:septal ring factor EnvC (AmiA/AmiB activator)
VAEIVRTAAGAGSRARGRGSRAVSGLLLLLLIAGWSGVAGQERSVDARRAELSTLKKQLEEKRRLIAKLRGEGENLERLLAETERERSMTERYLGEIARQERELEEEINGHRGNLETSGHARDVLREELTGALVSYYKERRVTAAELLVSSATFGELFARGHYWVRLIRQLQRQIGELDQLRAGVSLQLSEIEQRRQAARELREEREAQLRHLQAQVGARRQDRAELQRRLVASQAEIERLITEALRAPQGEPGKGLKGAQGRMPWPVEGAVIARFGTQVHPRYGTQVEHKGIEIAAAEGTPVLAVAAGRVVFEGWLGGYGRTVVLDHGGGYFTLYAHAAEATVQRGDQINAGQMIARVGSTESLQGPALYFEIRQQAEALDPLRWLRRKE